MIPKETIDEIFEKAIIEEVVAFYLPDLKKKGTNYWACCPFHNEKTPSFSVSPTKGIYKCFGCGKGGNAINFVMEIGGLSYPEALKELAAKYNIEFEETKLTKEDIKIKNEKEGVSLISSYANEFFKESLWETEEGKIIGLNYYLQRGFSKNIIKKFELGYGPKKKSALTKKAINDSYQKKFLELSGLSFFNKKNNNGVDRFNNRVIFPIHNYSGKVVGFGGRSLSKSHKAKYLNSPENPIYHKSKILYGLYFSKMSISKNNACYIVEGYTDVISMHEIGVENVVSASGTALSSEQINLIRRFTKNIILLFDSDEAGINASFKNIDIILKEGMNVKIITFPEGEDPDSYSHKLSQEEFLNYLQNNEQDFIEYKSKLLNQKDNITPSEKVENIKNIAKTISVIPDSLLRSEYCKSTSSLLKIQESDLAKEISNFLHPQNIKFNKLKDPEIIKEYSSSKTSLILEESEKEILRLLLNYGDRTLEFDSHKESVNKYISSELKNDNIIFSNDLYKTIFEEYLLLMSNNNLDIKYFLNHTNLDIQKISITLISKQHEISKKWEDLHQIFIGDETKNLENTIDKAILSLKQVYLKSEVEKLTKELTKDEDSKTIMNQLSKLNTALVKINKLLGRNLN